MPSDKGHGLGVADNLAPRDSPSQHSGSDVIDSHTRVQWARRPAKQGSSSDARKDRFKWCSCIEIGGGLAIPESCLTSSAP